VKGKGRQGTLLAVVVTALLALAFGGCGSDSKAATEGTASEVGTQEPVRSKPFLGESGKNYAAIYGREASASELAEARKIVGESLRARQARDWATQCATLSVKARQGTKTVAKCAVLLGREGKAVPKSVLKNNMAGAVAAFRVKDDFGYALYHGKDKNNWAMPMEREHGEWKVGSLIAEELI
jgi:hypothetical protein